jgi:multidrug efflux system outer membrane protein
MMYDKLRIVDFQQGRQFGIHRHTYAELPMDPLTALSRRKCTLELFRRLQKIGLLLLLQAGCMNVPAYQPPDLSSCLRDSWRAEAMPESTAQPGPTASTAAWWDQFKDPVLTELVSRLVGSNLSLTEARERVVDARARRGIVTAGRLPQVDLEGAYSRAATGDEAVTYQGPPPGEKVDLYQWGAVAGWELDLWGRVAQLETAADRDIEASREAYHGMAVSLVSELALAYLDVRTLEARLGYVERNIELRKRTLELTLVRQDAGTGSRLDSAQAKRLLQSTQALKPELLRSLALAKHTIAVLLGRPPGGEDLPAPGSMPLIPAIFDLGIPADLLVQRADIRQAERQYAAAVARTNAAQAEKYPRLTLSGNFLLQKNDAAGLIDPGSFVYSLGPGLQFPLFSGGRIESAIRVQQSQAEQARLALEQVLLQAVKEVEDAAAGVVQTRQQVTDLTGAAAETRTSVRLAEQLYDEGLGDLLQVTEAQRDLVATEDELLLATRNALAETVHLYRSLGGGWAMLDLSGKGTGAVLSQDLQNDKETNR